MDAVVLLAGMFAFMFVVLLAVLCIPISLVSFIAFRYVKHPYLSMSIFNMACSVALLFRGDIVLHPVDIPGWLISLAWLASSMMISSIFLRRMNSLHRQKEMKETKE